MIWGILIIMVVVVFNIMTDTSIDSSEISFSQFRNAVETGQVEEVTIKDLEVKGTFSEEFAREHHEGKTEFNTVGPVGEDLQDMLAAQQIEFSFDRADEDGVWKTILVTSIPLILLVMVLIFFMRQFQGGGGGRAMTFGKSRARLLNENQNKVTFNDIAGIDEAKEELQEIVEFLKNPKKFTRLGGRIPKGVLLMGSPGTGKTLLARGVAGEAGVPFFSISGSDFVEMFVGVGASRVRDLFEQGKKNAPCIIFIDEIDAVGRHRGSGMGGGHDEREQTLNQLLVEMDGFESNEGVILIAATNRADVLDPALLRPGRFDRRVMVAPPDVRGREQILKIHTRRTPIGKTVDLKDIARGTPGFSGADLENLVNEAALLAARSNKDRVEAIDFEEAKDKVLMGAERKSIVLTDEEKAVTAYHESGHAIVALRQANTDPVHKVTIIPRGRALGVTQQLPTKDRYNLNRDYVLERIAVMMGGRAAEELIYNQFTTGAGQDIKVATNLARQMVCEWGMSEAIGPLFYGESQEASLSTTRPYSEDLAREIDAEVRRIVKEAYQHAYQLLEENRELLELMTEALLEFEALDADEIRYLAEEGKLDWIREERQKKMAEEAEEAEKAPKTGFASKIKEQVPPVEPNLAPSNTW
ncbi:ATP-dependent metallopeptidase FtsH/Yme1/Tma family protein [Lujinxingia vulgaris]|uniref:ATP-dependent zinc metalloprotease FtsH n=1 Tax=Lujinxingia vulgaris TaxID=2600176 RepID=A0A5C6X1T2_9DELT|nr:ATP-dependent metallopeptidase FtsH/Yme1/Tma family protein [Lujinxingia vulgaris]